MNNLRSEHNLAHTVILISSLSGDYDREDESKASKLLSGRRKKRSYSREYYAETLVVVDHSMVQYYMNEDVNTYIFTIMNMVSAEDIAINHTSAPSKRMLMFLSYRGLDQS